VHIGIIAVGRMKSGPERDLVKRYLDRAEATGRRLSLAGFNVKELPESRAGSAKARKVDEAKAILGALPDGAAMIVLDEHGASKTSTDFARIIEQRRDDGLTSVYFVIGGADGLDHGLMKSATLSLGFSALTWPHQLVRVLLAEQLYRTTTILSGHPYHRGE
jgi:23S rRNA (pseudouridine1915-N3)-methyltransferase